jgi:hypothetical protein
MELIRWKKSRGWLAWGGRARWRTAGDVVTIFQISQSKKLVIEGKATIGKRVIDVDEQYGVEFANRPGMTYERASSIPGARTIRCSIYTISIGARPL